MNDFDSILLKVDNLFKYKYEFKGFPMILFVRFQLIRMLLNKKYGLRESVSRTPINLLKIILPAIKNAPRNLQKFKYVFFTNNLDNIKINGKYFDSLHDYFIKMYQRDSFVIQDSNLVPYREPRAVQNVFYEEWIKLKVRLLSAGKKANTKDVENIEKFRNDLENSFRELSSNEITKLVEHLYKMSVRLPLLYKEYENLLKHISPSIVFLTGASYGRKSYVTHICKEMGVPVCEHQHGVIVRSHPAYNYSSVALENEELKKFFPDYILTFGDFWNTQIRVPGSKTVTIGKPHLIEKRNSLVVNDKPVSKERKTILIVSQGSVTNIMVELAEELAKRLDGNCYRIIFKLHPGEVGFEERYKTLYKYKNVEIFKSGDIYNLIIDADYIVGYYSTVIFETLALGKKSFVYDTELSRLYIPDEVGIKFRTIDELVDLIVSSGFEQVTDINIDYYWARNWRENFINFVEQVSKNRTTKT